MENRDRDKLSKNTGSTPSGDVNREKSSNIGQQKSGSSVEFGKKTGHSEDIGSDRGDLGRSSGSIGSGGMQSDRGRSSGSSDLGDVDRGDMGSKKDDMMGNKKPNRGSGSGSSSESL